jgi:hypothetical protein
MAPPSTPVTRPVSPTSFGDRERAVTDAAPSWQIFQLFIRLIVES